MSTLTMLALIGLGSWCLASVVLAVLFGHSAAARRVRAAAVPVDEQPPALVPLALIDVDIALLQISVVPPAERTAAEREALDRLLDERAALTLPRRQPSALGLPGRSS